MLLLFTNHRSSGYHVALGTVCVVKIMKKYAERVNIVSDVMAQFLKVVK